MVGSRWGQGFQTSPLKKSQNIRLFSNTGPDHLENHKATMTAFNVGPSSARFVRNFTTRIKLEVACLYMVLFGGTSNSYIMGCPPLRGDNPRALASGLSYVQVDKHSIPILNQLHQCRYCTSRDVSR